MFQSTSAALRGDSSVCFRVRVQLSPWRHTSLWLYACRVIDYASIEAFEVPRVRTLSSERYLERSKKIKMHPFVVTMFGGNNATVGATRTMHHYLPG